MTALAEDRNTEFHPEGAMLAEKVAGSTTIYNGSLVNRNSTGYCKPGSNTAGEALAGVADQKVDNSSGSDGDKTVRLKKKGIFIFEASGLTQADVGKPLWEADDQTVTRTPGKVYAGNLAYFKSATEAPVDIAAAVGNPDPFRVFEVSAFHAGVVGASEVTVVDGFELKERTEVLRSYVDAKVAPGTGYNCTVKLTDGTTPKTVAIAETAKHGEDEAVSQVYAKDTDMDITVQDDNASAVTADINIRYVCREVP